MVAREFPKTISRNVKESGRISKTNVNKILITGGFNSKNLWDSFDFIAQPDLWNIKFLEIKKYSLF